MNKISEQPLLILGKLPPPYMGPAIATKIILDSPLKNHFRLVHINTQANEDLTGIGRWSFSKIFRNFKIYFHLFLVCLKQRPAVALIPISQSTSGFVKDSLLILIARLTGTKVLIHLRGSSFKRWLQQSSYGVRFYVAVILKLTSGVIVLGKKLRYLFEDYYPEDRIHVVPNGGNYSLPQRNRIDTDCFEIVYLANLQPSKGIEDVIQAIRLLKEKASGHFHLTVIGAWRNEHTRQTVSGLIEQYRLPVTIHTPETAGNKFQYLVNADAFVFTPREPEGHPWVIVEAMSCGLPVISTDQGAITESVIDRENGFIVPTSSPQHIAEKLWLLMNDTELRKTMGKQSRLMYELNFTEDKMVENLVKAFNHVIKNKK
jgi:glycosyltransferase involved in cell wall biosynthesis